MTVNAPFPSPTPTWHNNTYAALSPSRPELSAKGKNVLITGGGTGIGAATARAFAEAGAARIALLGRRAQPLLETKAALKREFGSSGSGLQVYTFPTDVTKQSEVNAAFAGFLGDASTAEHQKIDVVVSNAAFTGPFEPVSNVDGDAFLNTININLSGALYVAQAFLRYAAPDAVVVNVSSSAAHLEFGGAGLVAYSTAKLAGVRIWHALAAANPKLGVFHIQPGVVDTDMNREVGGVKSVGHEDHVSLPGTFSLWLASPEARFLNGKFLWANWDVEELKARREELETTSFLNLSLGGWPFGEPDWKPTWNAD